MNFTAVVCASAALLDVVTEGAVVPSPSTAKEEGVQDVRIRLKVNSMDANLKMSFFVIVENLANLQPAFHLMMDGARVPVNPFAFCYQVR